jgi:hypothetical protein
VPDGSRPCSRAVAELLDPGVAAIAGAAHGQISSLMPKGGISVSGHKVVEEGARALLIYVPGVMRIDVCPLEDGLQVIPRVLSDGDLRWGIDDAAVTDYGKTSADSPQPAQVEFRFAIIREPYPIAGRLLLSLTRARAHGPSHFAGHAVLLEMRDGGDVS